MGSRKNGMPLKWREIEVVIWVGRCIGGKLSNKEVPYESPRFSCSRGVHGQRLLGTRMYASGLTMPVRSGRLVSAPAGSVSCQDTIFDGKNLGEATSPGSSCRYPEPGKWTGSKPARGMPSCLTLKQEPRDKFGDFAGFFLIIAAGLDGHGEGLLADAAGHHVAAGDRFVADAFERRPFAAAASGEGFITLAQFER